MVLSLSPQIPSTNLLTHACEQGQEHLNMEWKQSCFSSELPVCIRPGDPHRLQSADQVVKLIILIKSRQDESELNNNFAASSNVPTKEVHTPHVHSSTTSYAWVKHKLYVQMLQTWCGGCGLNSSLQPFDTFLDTLSPHFLSSSTALLFNQRQKCPTPPEIAIFQWVQRSAQEDLKKDKFVFQTVEITFVGL